MNLTELRQTPGLESLMPDAVTVAETRIILRVKSTQHIRNLYRTGQLKFYVTNPQSPGKPRRMTKLKWIDEFIDAQQPEFHRKAG